MMQTERAKIPYPFIGRIRPYHSQHKDPGWGTFYLEPENRERRRSLHPGPCTFCDMALGKVPERRRTRFQFQGSEFYVIENLNPIVEDHRLIFPSPQANADRFLEHRIDLSPLDVALVAELVCHGFSRLEIRKLKQGDLGLQPSAEVNRRPWAIYANLFPGSGRSISHLHLGCVPAHHVPLMPPEAVPWQICQDAETGAVFSRLANTGFYALAIDYDDFEGLASTLDRFHQAMNRWGMPYNLVAFPIAGEGGEPRLRCVVVPRGQEFSEAVDQRIAGMEFLTGVLTPGANLPIDLSTSRRNLGFQQVTVGPTEQRRLERRLRSTFGLPPAGLAIYSHKVPEEEVRGNGRPPYEPKTLPNTDIHEQAPESSKWRSSSFALTPEARSALRGAGVPGKLLVALEGSGLAGAAPQGKGSFLRALRGALGDDLEPHIDAFLQHCRWKHERLPNLELRHEPNVLVRVTRSSICQSDRRVLLGSKDAVFAQRPLVLGHEAGGYIVDPGPWKDLSAGDKVVVLPHLTCDQCEFCRSYRQNLCQDMDHLGFHLHGSMVELMSFPYQCILPVPPSFPDDALTLVEPLACVLRAMFRTKEQFAELAREGGGEPGANGFTTYGIGPIGCLAVLAVQRFWPNVKIKAVDPDPGRREQAKKAGILDDVVEELPKGEVNHISFVASSKAAAYRHAVKSASFGGTVILFSGINTEELEVKENESREEKRQRTEAITYEGIHRQEMRTLRDEPMGGRCRLVGSSGYNFDDSARSISELRHHFADHYSKVQNVHIDGLAATQARYGSEVRSFAGEFNAIEALMAPKGIYDPKYGSDIADMIKTLIRL